MTDEGCYSCRNFIQTKFDFNVECSAEPILKKYGKPQGIFPFNRYSGILKCGSFEPIIPMSQLSKCVCK